MAKPQTAEKASSPDSPEAAPAKGKSKILIAGVLALVLVGGGVGGFLYWKSTRGAETKAVAKPAPPAPLLFIPVDPPFVVNFQGEQTVRFLQLEVRLASRDPLTIELMKANDPVIRNDLLLLFAEQKAAELATNAGKQKLRSDALKEVRRIVKSAGGTPETVEAVFFTTFVMQ
jgi:flagellar FliL protein